MKFSIGYQLPDENDSLAEIIEDLGEAIGEVYFAWVGEPSGRAPVESWSDVEQDKIKDIMIDELAFAKASGIKLTLLFNAACYGEEAISCVFRDHLIRTLSIIKDKVGIDSVTTTSPFVADTVKKYFPEIQTRASVNMRIGTIEGMEYTSSLFDGYYMQREYNRDLIHIKKLREWCDLNGKTLHLLANSGCMYACSFQSFHDNIVAHQNSLDKKQNTVFSPSFCWEYLSRQVNLHKMLSNTWIRPEDIKHYEKYFDTIKLAIRTHANPRKVISAYRRQSFPGNLPDLLEPGFSSLLKDHIIDNTRFPEDWFERVTGCKRNCSECGYCKSIFDRVLVPVSKLYNEKKLSTY